MKLFVNKDIRYFFWKISIALIIALLSGLIFFQVIIHDFKAQLLTNNYEIAGYMLKHGVSPSDVSNIFATQKTEQELSLGQEFLKKLGYEVGISNRLFPDVNILLLRYRLILAMLVVIVSILILTAFFLYFRRQQNDIEKANDSINSFMNGNTVIQINGYEEGSLSKLFASVNEMATSLNAHIEREKYTKEFLKETISDISHQLKTPLTALRMYNEIIQEESGNEETVEKFTGNIEKALTRMEILIQNLLKIAKFDSGTIIMNKKEKNIRVLMEKIISDFETRREQEHKNITLNGSNNVALYCDEVWITEAIGNLVKNSLDHMERGGEVKITWEETPAITRIIIKDNGAGIHPEDIHHIFKRFYRSRFSQDTQGIGLGLSLAKSIVEAHNGTITVESTLGNGSTFTLDFLKLTNM